MKQQIIKERVLDDGIRITDLPCGHNKIERFIK